MNLNELRDRKGASRPAKRVGRGIGSGTGKTSGAGHKGQKARAGVSLNGFEGGQMPLYRRLPKRGFSNYHHRKHFEVVNLGRLQAAIDEKRLDGGSTITEKALAEAGLVRGKAEGVRVLADGELKTAITIEVTGASKAAVAAVEAAGGKVIITAPAEPAAKPTKKEKKAKAKAGGADGGPDDDNA